MRQTLDRDCCCDDVSVRFGANQRCDAYKTVSNKLLSEVKRRKPKAQSAKGMYIKRMSGVRCRTLGRNSGKEWIVVE